MTTCAACLTPTGAAAMAVLAIRGPQAWEVVRELFQPRGRLRLSTFAKPQAASAHPLEVGRFHLGRFGTDVADEVVLSVRQVEPVPWLELHCHGGVAVVRLCLDMLRGRGVEICSWQELERHTTGSSHLHSAALAALVEARTVRTAAILLDQLQGTMTQALTAVRAALEGGESNDASARLAALLRFAALGRHLTRPWRVVVAGAPNVGKSSLVNAVAGYQRSIVAPTPGTTRDAVAVEIAANGWPIELIDTAGLRANADDLEAQGMQRARDAIAAADLCLWLLDSSTAAVWPDVASDRLRLVVNKIDLPPAWDRALAKGAPAVSAQSGAGVAELVQALANWLVPETPPAGAALPFTPELGKQIEAVSRLVAADRIEEARHLLGNILC